MSDLLQPILAGNFTSKDAFIYESSSLRRLLAIYKLGLLFLPLGAIIFFLQHRFFYSTPNDISIYIFMLLVGIFLFILYKSTALRPQFAENIGRIFIYTSIVYIWLFIYLKLFNPSNLEIDIVSPPVFIIIIMLTCSLVYDYQDLTLLTALSGFNFLIFSFVYLKDNNLWILNSLIFILIFYFLFLSMVYYRNLTESHLINVTKEAEDKRNSVIELTKNNIKLYNSISHEFLTPIHSIQATLEKCKPLKDTDLELLEDLKSNVESFKFWVYYLIDFNNFNNRFIVNYETIPLFDLVTELKTILLNNKNFITNKVLIFKDSKNQTIQIDKIGIFLILMDTIHNISKIDDIEDIIINISIETNNSERLLHIMVLQKKSNQNSEKISKNEELEFQINRKIAKHMNGTVSLELTYDYLLYIIKIPLKTVISENKDFSQSDKMKEMSSILVVDDLEDNRIIIKEYLKRYNFKITEASNGLEALDLLYDNKFDLVLMDIRMPKLDGISATREYRQWESRNGLEKTPIIFLTAYVNDLIDSKELKDLVDNKILKKPFRKENLIEILSEIT